jgi:aminoglycoside 3-N-acetyltransferase
MNRSAFDKYIADFKDRLKDVGVKPGDIIYVGSDIAGIVIQAKEELELADKSEQNLLLDALIDALKETVTEEGTLLFPVYSWDFCRGKGFDYYKTRGEVGALNNYILTNRKDFIRTTHPLYSFMVWGKDAKKLYLLQNQEAWGEASAFAYMHKNNAKELDLNVSATRSMTFKHYVEQSVKVPYRYPKFFCGNYTDENGVTEYRTYSMYVRDLSVELDPAQTNEFFIGGGAGRSVTHRGWDINIIELEKAYELLKDDLLNNGGRNVYHFTDYELSEKQFGNNSYEIGFLKDRKLVNAPE